MLQLFYLLLDSDAIAVRCLLWALAGAAVCPTVRCCWALGRRRLLAPERELAWTAFAAYAAGALAVLLSPRWGLSGRLNLLPLSFIWAGENRPERVVVQFNLLIALPLGIFLPMLFKRVGTWRGVPAVAAAAAAVVEAVQYFIGRTADIDDVLLRMAGSMAGYAIYRAVRRRWKGAPSPESRFMRQAE